MRRFEGFASQASLIYRDANRATKEAPRGCRLSCGRPAGLIRASFLGLFFSLFVTLCSVHAANLTDSYSEHVFHLLQAHRDGLPHLAAPADATAAALIRGGALYLAGDRAWIAEGDGRAGGLIMVRPLSLSAPTPTASSNHHSTMPAPGTWLKASAHPVKGDVVWMAYSPASYEKDIQTAKDLEQQGCLVVLFGPKLVSGPPDLPHWVDSYTAPTDDLNFTRMGNILSLWTLTAEVTAATSRQGKTLAFYQSDSVEGAKVRDELYAGLSFHDGIPQMAPVPTGLLSKEYLDYVQGMLQKIQKSEESKIVAVGQELSRRAAEGHPAALMMVGHMAPYLIDQHNKFFRYLDSHTERANLQSHLSQNGYFVFIGYVGVYLDLWREVRGAKATAVWIVSPLPTEVNFGQWHDTVIDQHWKIGDCAVEAPGYDVRILPPSGIAQIFIYEMMLRAAENHSGSQM